MGKKEARPLGRKEKLVPLCGRTGCGCAAKIKKAPYWALFLCFPRFYAALWVWANSSSRGRMTLFRRWEKRKRVTKTLITSAMG